MTNYEKETNINYTAADDFAEVYSAYEPDIRKFDKLVKEREEAICTRADKHGKSYRIPKSWVRIRPKRILTDEERKQWRQRFLK